MNGKPKINHPLTYYTVFIVALISIVASIYSNDIRTATGSSLAFMFLLGAFVLKMAIDDYMHFFQSGTDKDKAYTGLICNLLMYILIAAALANAKANLAEAAFFLLLMMLVGILWIATNYLGKADHSVEDRKRHVGWTYINAFYVAALSAYLAFRFDVPPIGPQWMFYGLILLVVYDGWKHRTMRRLANLSDVA